MSILLQDVTPTIEVPFTATLGTQTKPKLRAIYTILEKTKSSNNVKAFNAIFRALEDDKTNKISSCKTTYDAWVALRVAYKRDTIVDEKQTQDLQSEFEDLYMVETEPFNEYYMQRCIFV